MVDWTSSMQQYFEYYEVDPGTWRDVRKLNNIISCSISRDSEADTLGSASFETDELFGECYIRVYLVTVQNGVTEKHPLGTFLAQTPNTNFDGKKRSISIDAYTPLIELKENQTPTGYFTRKYDPDDHAFTTLDEAYLLVKEHVRAPVNNPSISAVGDPYNGSTLRSDFIAEPNETWLKYITALLLNATHTFALDGMGCISFTPIQDLDTLAPRWTYDDGNSSILYPDVSITHDLFGIPNIVEVTHSTALGSRTERAENSDPNSPISTISRGRDIIHKVTNPQELSDWPSSSEIKIYANKLLKSLSTLQCTVTYSHGYCPVKLGDCVRLNYERAGLIDVKAKVISQSIKCSAGCQVQEKAVFHIKLWR